MRLMDLHRRFSRTLNYIRFGDEVRIDAASHCQLRCPVCQEWDLKARVGGGYLRFEDFRTFVDRYENFRRIELSNNGEIFLNPDLTSIIEYAHGKQIELRAENGVNLNHIRDDTIEALVRFGFKSINVSIDGASDETYAIYRKRGSFSRVIENVSKINACKAAFGSQEPRLKWRFIVFGHNEHEIPAARRMAEGLNMAFELLPNVEPGYAPLKDPDFVAREMGYASMAEREQAGRGTAGAGWYCTGLWERVQINWDGRLLGCCVNTRPFQHNVFEVGLGKAIRAKDYRRAKQMLAGKDVGEAPTICSDCGIYRERVARKDFVDLGRFRDAQWRRLRASVAGALGRRRWMRAVGAAVRGVPDGGPR